MAAPLLLRLQGEAAAIFVFVLFVTQALSSLPVHGRAISGGGCVAGERDALLSFKQSFLDPGGRLSSWRGENCCQWRGVRCSDLIGHVVRLDLGCQNSSEIITLRGEMSSSIATLHHLRYLDLSSNDFDSTNIPLFLGSLSNLRYLDLSDAGFSGSVPPQLGNLSRLQYLDLSIDSLKVSDLSWLRHLSSLESLNMDGVNLSLVGDWVRMVNMLPNLKIISLVDCGLTSTISALPHSNLTHLEILDLSYNTFYFLLQHNWFWDVATLKELRLSGCEWSGPIPNELGNMSSLETLNLDFNHLSGIMPQAMTNLCNLQYLDFSGNDINGDVMKRIPQCSWSQLRAIYLHGANLIGQLPVWIGNLTNINYLVIAENRLVGHVPYGIGNMRSLSYLDLSQNMLVGSLPYGIGNMRSLSYLDLSQNMLVGSLPYGIGTMIQLTYLDLSMNMLKGSVPYEIRNMSLSHLDLSQNMVVGPLPSRIGNMIRLTYLDLSLNMLNGSIPSGIGNMRSLSYLDLSQNMLV